MVADEVRKLAERAAASTKEIGALIGSVQQGVGAAVQAMEASTLEATEGKTASEAAGASLGEILQSVQTVTAGAESVQAAAEQMSASVDRVLEAIETVQTAATENEESVGVAVADGNRVGGESRTWLRSPKRLLPERKSCARHLRRSRPARKRSPRRSSSRPPACAR